MALGIQHAWHRCSGAVLKANSDNVSMPMTTIDGGAKTIDGGAKKVVSSAPAKNDSQYSRPNSKWRA